MELLSAHDKDLGGGFVVRRLLPSATRRAVGSFVFFDHFGPIEARPEDNRDVRPHPHIGLATVTYLFEGAMQHRDSTGVVQRIQPGAINLMIAGRGVVHSERTPDEVRGTVRRSHGLQLWLALPEVDEDVAPSFSYTPETAIPHWAMGGVSARVLIRLAQRRSTRPAARRRQRLGLRHRHHAPATRNRHGGHLRHPGRRNRPRQHHRLAPRARAPAHRAAALAWPWPDSGRPRTAART